MMLVMGRSSSRQFAGRRALGSLARLEQSSTGTLWMKCYSPFAVCSLSKAYSVSIGGKSNICTQLYHIVTIFHILNTHTPSTINPGFSSHLLTASMNLGKIS